MMQNTGSGSLEEYSSMLFYLHFLFLRICLLSENRSLKGPLVWPVQQFMCPLLANNFSLWYSHQSPVVDSWYGKEHDHWQTCKSATAIAPHIKFEGEIANGVHSSLFYQWYTKRAGFLEQRAIKWNFMWAYQLLPLWKTRQKIKSHKKNLFFLIEDKRHFVFHLYFV